MSAQLSIGIVARRAGATVPTIRYYEEIGLLPRAARTAAGQRSYGEAAVRRLVFIRRCRDFGFSLEQVRELVGLIDHPERPCTQARDIAAGHLAALRVKLAELQSLEASLAAFVCSCETECAGGPVADCAILEDLALPAGQSRLAPPAACCGPDAA
ncbi:MAG TPA: helix-turn-helix domain-containing protein [Burkholderiaceae bacterium]